MADAAYYCNVWDFAPPSRCWLSGLSADQSGAPEQDQGPELSRVLTFTPGLF